MAWGSTGGGGVGTGMGTPEAARGSTALRSRRAGPPDADPPRRPGCLRTAVTTIAVLLVSVLALSAVVARCGS